MENALSDLEVSSGSFTSEAGSFRDRQGRVYYRGGSVYRGLNEKSAQDWSLLCSSSFFPRLMDEGKIVYTEEVSRAEAPDLYEQWALVLRHESIPFVSYPYEWTFGQLKAGALLHLELMLSALDEDLVIKDASAFNIQWRGTKPLFIDIPSFERLNPGEPWAAYRQFCQMFLYPLMLKAYKDISFQTWLRGDIDGIAPRECANLISLRDILRPGVFKHVYLQSKFERQYASSGRSVKSELKALGFHKELIKVNVYGLQKIIRKLKPKEDKSVWSGYADDNSYSGEDEGRKHEFVRGVVSTKRFDLVWDLGCNTGVYSSIAAGNSRYVVALEGDAAAAEKLYGSLSEEGCTNVLPLVMNLANQSPNLGWRGLERKGLKERGRPSLVLCLALIHHLVITANIPVRELVTWLADLGGDLIIEFVDKQDPMVKRLLLNKEDIYSDYEEGYFEACLSQRFSVEKKERLSSGTRTLYYCAVR